MILVIVVSLSLLACKRQRDFRPSAAGVVVEEIYRRTALEKAGIQPGDLLLRWRRLPSPPASPKEARGELNSVFDWLWLELEQASRGIVELTGRRGEEVKQFTVMPGLWGAEVRPWMPDRIRERYTQGKRYLNMKEYDQAIKAWEEVVEAEATWHLRCWMWLRLGKAVADQGDWKKSRIAFQHALDEAQDPFSMSIIWRSMGKEYMALDDFVQARRAFRSAWRNREEALGEKSIALSESHHDLARIALLTGDLDLAVDLYQRALSIQQELAPDSLDVAISLTELAAVSWDRGDIARAEELNGRATAIRQRLAPGTLHTAQSLHNLGALYWRRGDLDTAADFLQQSLAIHRDLAPDNAHVAFTLGALAVISLDRGDLDRAEDLAQRSLGLHRELGASSLDIVDGLIKLGVIARQREEIHRAMDLLQQALAIQNQLAPKSIDAAVTLSALGVIAQGEGDLSSAKEFHQRALRIQEKLAPGSLDLAASLHNLGVVAGKDGELSQATKFFQRALEIQERLAPGGFTLARTLHALALLSEKRESQGLAEADNFLRRALDALDGQISRIGGSYDVRGNFRAEYYDYYRDAIEIQVRRGSSAVALHTLERSRARTFLELLAERDTVFTSDIPEELDSERRRIAVRYDRVQQQVSRLNSRDHSREIEETRNQLRRLRAEAEDVEERIRRTSPGLAALQYPEPLDLESIRATLDPGTLVLSYSVGKDVTYIFTCSKKHGLRIDEILIGEEELRGDVEDFRELIGTSRVVGRRPGLGRLARRLYKVLIEPVTDRIHASDRLLIVADGPLHYLPWGSLRREAPDGDSEYLIEWRPFHLALSVTVYSELLKLRREGEEHPSPIRIAAFGDPIYPKSLGVAIMRGDGAIRSLAERALFDWEPLPYTRREVEGIASLYGEGIVRKYLGADATEENARSIGRTVRIYHFATHGYLDEALPLNSFLAFTVPEKFEERRENGLLQVWEIFERVRIDADLVVLSACESGVGADQKGEGLIGLTRAFHYAGARSVLATLWKVADDLTTSKLMVRFYSYLKAGRTKDEALRAAQLDLLREPLQVPGEETGAEEIGASAPYHWAAFQIYGDWR